jgi:hypothetical protein
VKTFITVAICLLLTLAILFLAFPRTEVAHFLGAYLAHPLDPQPVSFDWKQRAGMLAAAAACILVLHQWKERVPN